jgi:hypothetical protein
MAESLQSPNYQPLESHPSGDRREPWKPFSEATPLPLSIPGLEAARGELATRVSTCIRLDWEDLQCFEIVHRQFHQYGVEFANAIALRPSNTAYPAYSGVMVIMGAPKDGWLEATFSRPVQFVSGFVTSSRRTVVTAFDDCNRQLAQSESSGSNLATHSHRSPNLCLSLSVPNIHRVTFHTFNGHLTLDDFCFSD